MAESADASDLKSDDGDIVWVRPPLALQKKTSARGLFLSANRNFTLINLTAICMPGSPVISFHLFFAFLNFYGILH